MAMWDVSDLGFNNAKDDGEEGGACRHEVEYLD